MKDDWTVLLTEDERKDYRFGTISTCGALRSLAASRALVVEMNRAVQDSLAEAVALILVLKRDETFRWDWTGTDAKLVEAATRIALTEAEMLKRLEEKP